MDRAALQLSKEKLMNLTEAQHARIADLPEECRVVGVDHDSPIIEFPDRSLKKIVPFGVLREPSKMAVNRLTTRRAV